MTSTRLPAFKSSIAIIALSLSAGGNALYADGSPGWLEYAESMEIIFKPGIHGLREPIKLIRQINDFEEIDVDGFKDSKS